MTQFSSEVFLLGRAARSDVRPTVYANAPSPNMDTEE